MKLSEGLKGNDYIIEYIELPQGITRRLHTLGMTDGAAVTILGAKNKGPMIIKIRGSRFALGKGFCDGIIVKEARV